MFSNALWGNVVEKTGEMFVGIWILEMPSPQVVFVNMQKTAGVKKQLKQLTIHKI